MRHSSLFGRKVPSFLSVVDGASILSLARVGVWPRRAAVLVVTLLLGAVLGAAAQAQEGILEGQVVNGTAGAPDLGEGIAIVLHVYQGDSETATLETATGEDGRFRFGGLDTDPDLEYWPEASYLDVPYTVSGPLRFEDGESSLSVTLTVYETTGDDAAISLSSVHSIVESFGEVLRVTEIHLLSNAGDRAYVGGNEGPAPGMTVFVPLPEGAVGLSFGGDTEEGRFAEVDGGLRDTAPVPPGSETSMIFFSYHLTVADGTVALERRFEYPVANLNMLVAQPGLTLRTEQMESLGTQLFQDRQYELFVAQSLEAGTSLRLEFIQVADTSRVPGTGGMPSSAAQDATGSPRGNQGVLLWIGFGLAGLAVVGAVVYSATSARPTPAQRAGGSLASDPRAQRMLAELVDLEEALEAGRVDEAAIESQRAEIYRELKSL